jgi:hypothetical protein
MYPLEIEQREQDHFFRDLYMQFFRKLPCNLGGRESAIAGVPYQRGSVVKAVRLICRLIVNQNLIGQLVDNQTLRAHARKP